MRLLLLTNLYPPDVLGGYELLARDVAEGLRARGHEVHVLTTGERRAEDPPWVHRDLTLARAFDRPASLDRIRHAVIARGQRKAAARVAALGFDGAIVMSLRRLGMHAVRALEAAGLEPVFCFNDDWLLSLRPLEARTTARRLALGVVERGPLASRTWRGVHVDRAVYVSASIREALVRGGAPVPEGVVCFQGVDRSLFHPRPGRAMPGSPRLLYAGRIHPTKGCDVAIRALANLRASGTSATLALAGTGAPEELERLRGIAAELGVSDAVTWLGFVARETLGDVYRDHDVFLFPSLWDEPAGLTYLEAMACGLPVVAIARGGAKELLVDQDNSLVVEDDQGMARAVQALVDAPELAPRLVRGGLQTVTTRASLEGYVEAIERSARSTTRVDHRRESSWPRSNMSA